jgi:hypothetical protein
VPKKKTSIYESNRRIGRTTTTNSIIFYNWLIGFGADANWYVVWWYFFSAAYRYVYFPFDLNIYFRNHSIKKDNTWVIGEEMNTRRMECETVNCCTSTRATFLVITWKIHEAFKKRIVMNWFLPQFYDMIQLWIVHPEHSSVREWCEHE